MHDGNKYIFYKRNQDQGCSWLNTYINTVTYIWGYQRGC